MLPKMGSLCRHKVLPPPDLPFRLSMVLLLSNPESYHQFRFFRFLDNLWIESMEMSVTEWVIIGFPVVSVHPFPSEFFKGLEPTVMLSTIKWEIINNPFCGDEFNDLRLGRIFPKSACL